MDTPVHWGKEYNTLLACNVENNQDWEGEGTICWSLSPIDTDLVSMTVCLSTCWTGASTSWSVVILDFTVSVVPILSSLPNNYYLLTLEQIKTEWTPISEFGTRATGVARCLWKITKIAISHKTAVHPQIIVTFLRVNMYFVFAKTLAKSSCLFSSIIMSQHVASETERKWNNLSGSTANYCYN